MKTIKRTVVFRGSHYFSAGSQEAWLVNSITVEISANCPTCGEPRGEARGHNFFENDQSHYCQRWDNACGHIDKYADVLAEAASNGLNDQPALEFYMSTVRQKLEKESEV